MSVAISILFVGRRTPDLGASLGLHTIETAASPQDAAMALARRSFDAVLIRCSTADEAPRLEHWPSLAQAVQSAAVLIELPTESFDLAQRLVQRGVQDVLVAALTPEVSDAAFTRALTLGLVRKRLDLMQRKGGSIDLATGLPTAVQWMDHLTHLCVLREREPAPMAVLVLRIEGLATVEAQRGPQVAQVLRRKVAVRLRSALRASDLVGSLGNDAYAVLLTWLLAPQDSVLVRDKLVKAMKRPFSVSGENLVVAIGAGCALYPEQARDAEALLRIAHAESASMPGLGRAGFANRLEAAAQGQVGSAGSSAAGAANDEAVGDD
jgi:GGDEF domain-containing protein